MDGHLARFLAIFDKGDNFCGLCFPAHQTTSEKGSILKGKQFAPFLSGKGSTQKRKNLLPMGANSFFFELNPFQKGAKTILT